jgi:hypothetical protein
MWRLVAIVSKPLNDTSSANPFKLEDVDSGVLDLFLLGTLDDLWDRPLADAEIARLAAQ